MRNELFYDFLTRIFKGERNRTPLEDNPARDACSRCARVEKTLELDLDAILNGCSHDLEDLLASIDQHTDNFEIDGNEKRGIASIKNAARRYHDFRAHEAQARSTES